MLVFSTDHETSVNVGTSFTVDAPNYTISANPTSLDFGAKVEGYSSPPDAQTVDITNTGNLSVTLTLPTNANYDIATGDPLTLAPNATATVSIQPKTGLAAGTYDPVLVFSTDHETSVNVGTSFTVENSNYTIEANKASLDFGTSIEGYSPPPAVQTVEIKNSGNLSVDLTLPTNANYDIATGDSLTLAPNATATVNVRPKEGLSPGTYDPTLRFTTNHATSADVDVTFTVIDAVYSIAAEPAAKDFGNATIGYAPIAPITVRVTNTGNKIVTLTQPAGVSYTVGSLSKTVLNPADFATFDLGPNTGLPVGTYPETVTISGSNDTRATVDLAFTVDPVLYGTSGSDTHYLNTGSHLIITSDGRFSDFQGCDRGRYSADGHAVRRRGGEHHRHPVRRIPEYAGRREPYVPYAVRGRIRGAAAADSIPRHAGYGGRPFHRALPCVGIGRLYAGRPVLAQAHTPVKH